MTLRVLHLLSNRWNSAITEYALSAALALKKQGTLSTICVLRDSPAEKRARHLEIPHVTLSSFGFPSVKELKSVCRDFQPQWLITYGGPEHTLACLLRKLVPFHLTRFVGHDVQEQPGWFRHIQNIPYQMTEMIIAPAKGVQERLDAQLAQKVVRVVTLGLDDQKFHPTGAARTLDLQIFGRLDPVKGHREFFPVFIAARKLLPEAVKKVRLVITGLEANMTAQELVDAGNALGLTEADLVVRTVHEARPAEVMSASLIGVIPSLSSEIICRVAEEFLLCGTPIFVSGVGSLDEVVFSGAGGSYKGQTVDGAAEQLAKLIVEAHEEPPAKRRRRAEEARQRFSLEVMGKELIKVLQI